MTAQTGATDAARREIFARRLRAAATQTGPARTGAGQTGPAETGAGRDGIPRGGDGPVPQSRAQHELWIQNHYLESNALYSVHQANSLRGPLDVAALEAAIQAVAARHDALRMVFPDDSHTSITEPGEQLLSRREVPGGSEAERRQAALEQVRAAIAQSFDLGSGPLLRALLIELEPQHHLLLLNLHHSITDGVSFALLYRELGELYTARVAGRTPDLAVNPLQYSDFCRWQAQRNTPENLSVSLDYWRDALANIEPILELPADRPRPAEQSHAGAVVSAELEAGQAARLRALAGQHGTTLSTALLCAFGVVLHRRSGQRSFGVGSMLSGRTHPELDDVLGLFATTAVLGVDLRDSLDFATFLRRQHQVVIGAIGHQDVSFSDVVEAVRPPRDVSRNPLFQVLFQHESGLDIDVELSGLDVEAVELDAGQAKVDLGLFTSDQAAGRLAMHLSYATDLYDQPSAQAILDQVVRVIEAACENPGCLIESLELMPVAQRSSVVDGWNATAMDYPDSNCVHELFEQQVDAHPDAVAIRDGDMQVSYLELDQRANRIANRLLELGVGTESLVGLCIEHSIGMFAALLGILKAGAGYVPLDPSHPRDRLDYILQDTAARVAVTSSAVAASLPDTGITTLLVDSAELELCSSQRPAAPVTAENLIYAMYTSGSTGRPKGVLLNHRGLINYLWWAITGYGLTGEHGAPMLGSIAFDLSIPNFLLPLIGGKDVTVLAEEDRSLAGLTELLLQDQDFSLLKITPAHLDVLRGTLALRDGPSAPIRSVRTFVVGADEVKAETVRAWSALAPGARIINEYGPTETVVGCSVYEVPADHDLRQRVPIGRPIGNTTMYVLDPQLNPVPPGVVGELFIGGHGVARGYLNRPGLTASKFLPDPFSTQPGARFYRTGDLARFRGDGNLDFLGRQDHQVKIRGFRIELGEIETCLLQHPGICEAVAATHTAPGREPRLFAYVVPHAGSVLETAEIKSYLRRSLPDYLVPATIEVTDAIPLSDGGKVDRRLLIPPVEGPLADDFVAPVGPLATALADIWAELLGTARIGAGDNFFDLGGDSILVIQLANRAKARGLRLSPRQVYRHQTLDRIAETITLAVPGDPAPAATSESSAVGAAVPLTPSQRWLVEHPAGLARGHIASEYLELPTWVSCDQLSLVLAALQEHHEALRISQQVDGEGRWSQRIAAGPPPAALAPEIGYDTAPQPGEILRVVQQLGREIDIENGPLLRAALLRERDTGSAALVLSIHHLATDGLSWQVLLEDLWTGLQQLNQGQQLSLPPVDVAFSSWSRELALLADSPQLRAELPLWTGPAASTVLPVDHSGASAQLPALPRATFTDLLDADQTAALVGAHSPGASRGIGDLMLVTFAQLLARWSGSDTISIEVSGHGRHHDLIEQDSSRTVGWLAVRYPVSFQLPAGYGGARASDAASRAALLRQVAAIPNNGMGFALLKYLSSDAEIRVRLAERAEPPASFNYLGRYEDRSAAASQLLLDEGHTNFGQPDQPDQLISLVAAQVGDRLRLAWTYRPQLHTEATIIELARRYRELLLP